MSVSVDLNAVKKALEVGDLRARDRRSSLNDDDLFAMLAKAVQIRTFEEKVREMFMQGLVAGTTHLSTGHEAVSVGSMAALREDDYVYATYRGHHHALSVGIEPRTLFAELLGRSTGNCGGMGGSTHAATDLSRNLMGTSLIVGAAIPMAAGTALASRMRGDGRVTVCFFGDGTSNTGAFHEGLNLAAVWNAPVVYIIENNGYGEYSPWKQTTAVADLAVRAHSYGIPGRTVDGQDAVAMFDAVSEAVERARSGGGPSLIEAKTYRYSGHSRTDPAKYRPAGELARWQRSDPIDILADYVRARRGSDAVDIAKLKSEAVKYFDELASSAAGDPFPTFEETRDHVFA